MRKNSKPKRRIVIAVHGKSIKQGTLNNILKDAKLSVEELKELL